MIKNVLATQSLLDIWNSDTGNEDRSGNIQFPERIKLQEKLQDLLKTRLEYRQGDELFEEYHSNFKWEVHYMLNVHWEVDHPEDPGRQQYQGIWEKFEFPLEELRMYLYGDKEPPDYRSYMSEMDEIGEGVPTGSCRLYSSVEVSNLRPKWWDNLHSF